MSGAAGTAGAADERGGRGDGARVRRKRYRTVRELLGSIIIGFELIIVCLATVAINGLGDLPAGWALGGGAALMALMAFTVWALRYPWGLTLGWVVQLLIVATGFVNGAMFIAGGVFLASWIYVMIKGAAIDRKRAPIIAEYKRRVAAGEIDPDDPDALRRLATGG